MLVSPEDLTQEEKATIFQHFIFRLGSFRNTAQRYAGSEWAMSTLSDAEKTERREQFERGINDWAQTLLEKAWIVCQKSESGSHATPALH
jgi:hypothetical protein